MITRMKKIEIGLVKKIERSASVRSNARLRFSSAMLPNIIPRRNGAPGILRKLMIIPSIPNTNISLMSKILLETTNAPMTQQMKTIGMSIFMSTESTLTLNFEITMARSHIRHDARTMKMMT